MRYVPIVLLSGLLAGGARFVGVSFHRLVSRRPAKRLSDALALASRRTLQISNEQRRLAPVLGWILWVAKKMAVSESPDCFYCRRDQRLHDLMIEIAPLTVSTLYLFKEQTHPGRCVVAYRGHVNELFELPDPELALFAKDIARAAHAIKTAFGATKMNYGAYSDKLPHLHFHLVPKYSDGANFGTTFEMMPAAKKLLSDAEYEEIIRAITARI